MICTQPVLLQHPARTFMMRTMAASICGLRSSSTFSRVSAFSFSFSRCTGAGFQGQRAADEAWYAQH